jgi:glycerophosphoryl diester phosphodiesterase
MHRRTVIAAMTGGTAAALLGGTAAFAGPDIEADGVQGAGRHGRALRPLVIGHRGAWGYRPEHTAEAYHLAFRIGADIVKPDVVFTKDGVLIDRNSPDLTGATDIANHPEFASRRTTKVLDGVPTTGWFAEDFTLAEIKTLGATERMADLRPANTRFNGSKILTMQEVIDLVKGESRRHGRRLGIAPDVKRPTYYRAMGRSIEEELVKLLRRNKLTHRHADVAVHIQSFEPSCLQRFNRLVDLPLVQLIDAVGKPYDFTAAGDPRNYTDLVTPEGLRWVHGYANTVSINKDLIIPRDATAHLLTPTTVVRDAHRAGLTVHAWRFCEENTFLPADFRLGTDPAVHGNFLAEFRLFFRQGIDAMVSDFPDGAAMARRQFEIGG